MLQSNYWSRFLDLIPQSPRLVGNVSVVLGGGRFRVTIIGGGTLEVSGSDSGIMQGTRVFVKDGKIESVAPGLNPLIIDV